MLSLQLPGYRRVGEVRRWYLPIPNRVPVAVTDGSTGESYAGRDRDERDGDGDVDVEYFMFSGKFIGFASSWTDNHWGHREEFVPRGSRCNACRWFEIRIFRELAVNSAELSTDVDYVELYERNLRSQDLGDYVVYKAGMSIVPPEIPYCRYDVISSPFEVVEALTTRKHTDRGPTAFITKPSALALASAARFDDELQDAYVNRAVS